MPDLSNRKRWLWFCYCLLVSVQEVDPVAEQRRLYGAPVGESVRRVTGALGLSQAAVARTLGLSAPMLSQVVNGHRVKLGNPLAVQRLVSLLALADEVEAGLPFDELGPRVEAVAQEGSTTLTRRRDRESELGDLAAGVTGLLRAVASGRQLAGAADVLATDYPEIAEVLRTYGTGRPDEARAHLAAVEHLL